MPRRNPAVVDPDKAASVTERAFSAAKKAAEKTADGGVARQEMIDRALRLAAKVELPTHPQDDLLIMAVTQKPPRKRLANSAYDDRDGIKRRRFNEDSGSEEEPSLFPWERNITLEQPPNPFDLGLEFEDQRTDPIEALGAFSKLSAEIREEILRYLLICDQIRVFRGWSLVYSRNKPGLHLAIMSTCKVLRLQGLQILFGENTFMYDVRDPLTHHRFALFHNVVFNKGSIPINQYGHLIRHVGIYLTANRVGTQSPEYFHKAIQKFLPGHGLFKPANLHTLTIILGSSGRANESSIYQTLRTQYFTPAAKVISSLNVQFVRVVAGHRNRMFFEHVIDLRHSLWKRHEEAGELPTKDCESARRSFLRRVNLGRARVHNIPTRVWELSVFGPEKANRIQPYWKRLDLRTHLTFLRGNMVRARPINEAEVSLPEDWEEDIEELESQPVIEQNAKPWRSRKELIESTKAWLEGLPESGYGSVDTEDSEDA
ncbi:hypothetical protein F4776DRAFT_626224 [Hypoxylon sp. NC0597]|nr:hypothetical protein F4776DRAFT_626224 [Hypoxylon sp. NC0597]